MHPPRAFGRGAPHAAPPRPHRPATSACRTRLRRLPALSLLAPAALAAQSPSPSRAPAGGAPEVREIRIRALDGLRFDLARLAAQPGARLRFVFENRDPSGMQHNLVVARPGARERVVSLALALGARGAAQSYVPATPLVLAATPQLATDGVDTLEVTLPAARGIYPYLCTFPGHGVVMYGALYVGVAMPPLAADLHVPPNVRTAQVAATRAANAVTRPAVRRQLMPDAGPAAIAVALPGRQNYTWDAGAGRLRYAWVGGFVDRAVGIGAANAVAMQTPARLLGTVYYRAGDAYPLRVTASDAAPTVRYLGYHLRGGIPEFRYLVDGVEVTERITPARRGDGLTRTFAIRDAAGPVHFVHHPQPGVAVRASAGTWDGARLRLSPEEARQFVVTLTRTAAAPAPESGR